MAKTKLQQYADIQALVQKDARDVAKKVYKEESDKSKYKVPQVPYHTHNGSDSPSIREWDVIKNIRSNTQLISITSETIRFTNIPNMSTLMSFGFAANNAGGGGATERATITGEADFGKCYIFTGSGSSISLTTNVSGIPYIQSCNFVYVAGSSQRVGIAPYLAYATDGSSVLVQAEITNYTPNFIEIQITLATGWQLQTNLIFK